MLCSFSLFVFVGLVIAANQRGGWWWRYDLAPAANGGTNVTLTYDWIDTPQAFRDQMGVMPPFPAEFLDQSLAALERHVTS